jgi:putative ABC transport system permease protein
MEEDRERSGEYALAAEFHFFERQTNLFKEVVPFDNAGPGFNLTSGRPEQVSGIHVTEGYFCMYGAPVVLGRTFTQQEDSPHGGKVVVLSYGLWQRRFGGDPAIVGKSISLGNEPYTVVGVVGKHFIGDVQADLWLPFQIDPMSSDGNVSFCVTGLLRPGVTIAQANAQLLAVAPEFRREFPNLAWVSHFRIGPLLDSIIGDARNSLMMMLGAVGLVLLIACANVANLLLARATVRKREFAIRTALGASRARIVRQLLTESALLALAGGIFGTVLGFAGMRALLAISPAGLPRIGEDGSAIGLDWRVLSFTLGVALLTGILIGLFPALSASRSDLNSALKESANRSGTGFREGGSLTAGHQRNLAGSGAADWRGAPNSHLYRPARRRSGLRRAQCSDHGDVAQRPTLPEDSRAGSAFAGWPQPAQCPAWGRSCCGWLLAAHRCRRWDGVPDCRAPGGSTGKELLLKPVDEHYTGLPQPVQDPLTAGTRLDGK